MGWLESEKPTRSQRPAHLVRQRQPDAYGHIRMLAYFLDGMDVERQVGKPTVRGRGLK